MTSSTIVVQGITYDIEVDGGSFGASGFIVLPGSAATNVTFGGGGTEDVQNGGLSDNNTFSGINASLTLEAGALSYQDTFTGASSAEIYGTALNLSAVSGGLIDVDAGGTLKSGQFGLGSDIHILAGGNDHASYVNSGDENIYGNDGVSGEAVGVTVENYGVQTVWTGGVADDSVVTTNGQLKGEGGTFVNFQIQAGASAILYSGSTFDGGTVAGNLNVNVGAIGKGILTIENGADVMIPLADIAAAGSTVGVELLLTGTTMPALEQSTEPIQVTLGSDGILDMGSTVITIANGAGAVLDETLVNGYIVLEVPCYTKGTMIAVIEDGMEKQFPVEELVEGDEVVTKDGTQIIQFIGKRSYDGRFIANDEMKLPICVKTGALGEGLPVQDLYISPGHALLIDNVLVQARHLVNGVNITQADSVERVDYFHIGLRKHAVVKANGCWAESFYDDNNNISQFQNIAKHVTARRVSGTPDAMYRPLIHCGDQIEKMRHDIAFRATDLLQGFVDGITVIEAPKGKKQGVVFINGWSQNLALGQTESPVKLEIYALDPKTGNEQKIGEIVANMYRKDLKDAFHSSGRHSFQGEFSLPKGISAHNITVRGAFNGQIIGLTPEATAALTPPARLASHVRKAPQKIDTLEIAA